MVEGKRDSMPPFNATRERLRFVKISLFLIQLVSLKNISIRKGFQDRYYKGIASPPAGKGLGQLAFETN